MRTLRAPVLLVVLSLLAAALAACGGTSADPEEPGEAGEAGGPGRSGGIELVTAETGRAPGDPARITEVVASLHQLAGGLYAQVASREGNVVFSPYSVAVALAMAANGASGETAAEMRQVLGAEHLSAFNRGLNALAQHLASLAGEYELPGGKVVEVTFEEGNALFGQAGIAWAPGFLRVLARQYGAGMRVVDFIHAPEQARRLINEWTARQTGGRIQKILPRGAVNDATRLVLVNALSLQAPWAEPFDSDHTEPGVFHLPDGATVRVPMMTDTIDGARYASGDGWQAVQLPYAGGGLAMTVIVPAPGQLDELEQRVARGGLAEILGALAPQPVELTLPRWEFRTSISLQQTLSALGMPTAFTAAADFRGMTAEKADSLGRDLFIQDVHHQAFISVDEEGTEAAAATAVGVGVVSLPQYRSVVVDRPFLFVLHDTEHHTPLFLGRVTSPAA